MGRKSTIVAMIWQADGGSHKNNRHGFLKRFKRRIERRRAKADPECQAGYGKYRGYEL